MSLTKASLVDLGRQAASLKDEKNPNSRLRLYESMAKYGILSYCFWFPIGVTDI